MPLFASSSIASILSAFATMATRFRKTVACGPEFPGRDCRPRMGVPVVEILSGSRGPHLSSNRAQPPLRADLMSALKPVPLLVRRIQSPRLQQVAHAEMPRHRDKSISPMGDTLGE
jgi:hypothetical protein